MSKPTALYALLAVLGLGLVVWVSRPWALAISFESNRQWSGIYHKAGAEHITTASGVSTATGLGINLSMNYSVAAGSALDSSMQTNGMRHLDRRLADLIYNACSTSGDPAGSCSLTSAEEAAVVNHAISYLNSVKDNPRIAGYYILDDSPGNVNRLLQLLTAEVHRVQGSNVKPTVCAFVSTLDFKTSPTGSWLPAHYDFDRAVANYSTAGCDIVDIYSYGVGQTSAGCIPSTQVDWAGSNMIPYVKSVLQSKGWNPAAGFMATPQTFDFGNVGCPNQTYNTPTGANIATETAAFCAAGANSILAYLWTDPGGTPQQRGLQQVRDWRTGYQNGVNQCKDIWDR